MSQRTDLGRLVFTVPENERDSQTDTQTGNLLSSEILEVIQPNAIRSFHLRLSCARSNSQILIEEFHEGSPEAPRISIGSSLDALDRGKPEIGQATHVFVVIVEVLTEDGKHVRLYSDWIYALSPEVEKEAFVLGGNLALDDAFALPPGRFAERVIESSIKTYRETLAFQLSGIGQVESSRVTSAKSADANTNSKPFDLDAISLFCYSGDTDSPIRRFAKKNPMFLTVEDTSKPDSAVVRYIGGRVRRSNVVDVLDQIQTDHKSLWPLLKVGIERMAKTDKTPLRRKAQFVLDQLSDHDREVSQ